MKKFKYLLVVILLMIVSILNLISINGNNFDVIVSLDLLEAKAQEDCGEATCIPNDCPFWNPFCEEFSGSDPSSYWVHDVFCSYYVTDCYPGTGQCTPGTSYVVCSAG